MKTLLSIMAGAILWAVFAVFAVAQEPFVVDEHYKGDLTLEQLADEGPELFRSDAAFNLLVDHVGRVAEVSLTGEEFQALMDDPEQVQVRVCSPGEEILTGALDTGHDRFHWFTRPCYKDEKIVQVKLARGWTDVLSLACLNGVRDKTPVDPPSLIPIPTDPPPSTPQFRLVEKCEMVKGPVRQSGGRSYSIPGSVSLDSCTPSVTSPLSFTTSTVTSQEVFERCYQVLEEVSDETQD